LGADSIRQSLQALIVGSILVIVFMVIYYYGAGLIALVALTINILTVLALLALFRATLTLSGIGGILLTVGMAVDANVLIFERLREEAKRGGSLKAIINAGFGKAFSTIFDANATTLVTALVLLQFGSATMQGFALTMTVGIFTTLYAGLFVTRVVTDTWALPRGRLSLGALQVVRDTKIDFMKMRFGAYALSLTLLLVGIGGLIHNKGLLLGVDFASGLTATVDFSNKNVGENDIRAVLPEVKVQRVLDRGVNQFILTSPLLNDDVGQTNERVTEELTKAFPGAFEILGAEGVGRAVGAQFAFKAFSCVFISAICILIYVWFRFELAFGAAAVVALFHDIILTLGLLELFEIPLTLEVVAALMMVFGYSINDTIVVFDRIRENMRATFTRKIGDLFNQSVNQTLSRTLITSGTTLLALLAMWRLGGEGLRDFSVTLLMGIVVGTYSSIFVATPILYEWRSRRSGALSKATRSIDETGADEVEATGDGGRPPRRPTASSADKGPRSQGRRVAPIR
jgi:SecD/SecF fusion protein